MKLDGIRNDVFRKRFCGGHSSGRSHFSENRKKYILTPIKKIVELQGMYNGHTYVKYQTTTLNFDI